MGESGSLVQPAGSAAFLSSEMGEQQSRNVPWREKRHKQRERKRQEATRKNRVKGRVGLYAMGGLKCWTHLSNEVLKSKTHPLHGSLKLLVKLSFSSVLPHLLLMC